MRKSISIISSNERYDEALKMFKNTIKLFKCMDYEVEQITSHGREKCVILSEELKPIKIECFVWSESKRARYYEVCFIDKALNNEIIDTIKCKMLKKGKEIYF